MKWKSLALIAVLTVLAWGSARGDAVTLSWTAPGDDGYVGRAAAYELRYASTHITESNWDLAEPVGNLPAPLEAGTRQSVTVDGLDPQGRYFFALKTRDEAGNWSALSNLVSWGECYCVGGRGNVDGDALDQVNLADLTCLVTYLFRDSDIAICGEEANVDGDPEEKINVVDVRALVLYLYENDDSYMAACP